MTWTADHPEVGNMAEIGVYASRLRQRITALDNTRAALESARSTADSAAFGGSAGDAWRASITPILAEIASMRSSLETLEKASHTYKSEVESLAANVASVRHHLDSERSERSVLATYAYDAPGTPDRIAEIDATIRNLLYTVHGYAEMRRMLDNNYCAALESTATINSARYQALLDRYGPDAFAGSMRSFFALRDKTVDEYADLAARIAAGDGSDEDYARLEEFLREIKDDPTLASDFWRRLGGEDAYSVLYEAELRVKAGDADDLAALESFATAFRESLSVGSAGWTDAEASEFADGLFKNTGTMSGLEVISYLFDDPEHAPMGSALTVAAATIFDEWERNPERMGQITPVLVETAALTGLGQLMFDENSDMGEWNAAGNDPMSRVLETLGGYPEEALDWLTDSNADPYWDERWDGGEQPSTGEGRIDYWFGERAWNSDGFTGAGSLWDGALSAADGVRDPSAAGNSPTVIDQLEASAHIINALGDAATSTFTPETLALGAQNDFGESLATLLPRLAESPITEDLHGTALQVDGHDYVDTNVLESNEHLLAPGATYESVARVWGAVGSTPGGLAHLDAAVNLYTNQVEIAALSGADGAPSLADAFDRIAQIEGFHTGATGGAVALEALRHDEQFKEMVDTGSTLIGLIPIPGLKDVPGVSEYLAETGVEWAYDLAVGEVKSGIKDAIVSHWGNEYSAALDSAAVSDLAGRDALDAALRSVLNPDNSAAMSALGVSSDGGSGSQGGNASQTEWLIDNFVGDRRATYRDAHLAALAVNDQDVYESYRKLDS